MNNIISLEIWQKNKYIEINNNEICIELIKNISSEYCNKISKLIKKENIKNWEHMIEKAPEEIYKQVIDNWWVIAKINDHIVWFIWQKNVSNLVEIWSLIVSEKFRNMWIWKSLVNKIIWINDSNFSYIVSNTPYAIKAILFWKKFTEIETSSINNELFQKIEKEWKLLEDDRVFWNNNFILYNYLLNSKLKRK